jgi:hypothetical protein
MVSTWRAFGYQVEPEIGVSILHKPRHSFMGVPNRFGGSDRLSPSFMHFIGLKPQGLYKKLAAKFREKIAT